MSVTKRFTSKLQGYYGSVSLALHYRINEYGHWLKRVAVREALIVRRQRNFRKSIKTSVAEINIMHLQM